MFSIHQPHYLPWLGYFHKIYKSDLFIFLDEVQFVKREFQNRNRILCDKKVKWLTVPVVTKGKYSQKIKDVEIDNSLNWRRSHLDLIKNSYRKTPFFNKYFPLLEKKLGIEYTHLCDLNIEMVKFYLDLLEIDTPVLLESEIGTDSASTERIIELSEKTGDSVYLSGTGGKNYMDMEMLEEKKVQVKFQNFSHPEYRQETEKFEPYLGIIDLIFNMGSESREIIISGGKND